MAAPSVDDLARSFERYLRAGNKSPRTIETYLEAVAGFSGDLAATSRRSLDQARREDVEAWIAALLARWKPSTAHNRYRGLHAFYRWLEEEEDIPSPMAKMKPPAVPDRPSRSSASRSSAPCSPSAPARTSTPAATPRC
jgi:site-specific recombinase XerD